MKHIPETARSSGWLAMMVLMLLAACAAPPPAPVKEERRELPAAQKLVAPFTGDYDAAVDRGVIRALVIPGPTSYYVNGIEQGGLTYEALKMLEQQVNEELGHGHPAVHVIPIPTTRDRILPELLAGRGDIAAANLTLTELRQQQVQFSDPLYRGVDELLVASPAAPAVTRLEDLSGKQVFVRQSSSYWEHLQALNHRLRAAGREPVALQPADELLETGDIIEMVNAGLVDYTFADNYIVDFWRKEFAAMAVYPDIALAKGGEVAWAVRPGNPGYLAVLNRFVEEHRQGTLLGNILFKRYYSDGQLLANARGDEDRQRFEALIGLFRQYGAQYGFDELVLAAMGYQESRLDQAARSDEGAIGVMQMLKSTAADPNVGIPDIEEVGNNIHAGARYLRFLIDRYFNDPEIDKLNRYLLAFASYNAGPARIASLREQARELGLDANQWFRNVELVAAREIGAETTRYVSNIYKYYLAYKLVEQHRAQREAALQAAGKAG